MLRKVSDQVACCYQRASECRAKAANAFNEAAKQEYLDMERRWLMLARSYEFSDRLTDYNNEVERRLQGIRPPELQHPAIPGVRCPECGKRMRLGYIEPCEDERRSADTSTFTCACGYTYQLAAERRIRHATTDLMKRSSLDPTVDSGDRLAIACSHICNGLPGAALLRWNP
jgi:hypothetical protein